jgi:FAD:protein FMN transferase
MTPPMHVFAHEAMATTFEARLVHADAHYAEQAAQACFAEADRLERILSRFDATSEVACIGRLAAGEMLRISADTFDCLRIALEVQELTGGAFDPTLGAELDRRRGHGPALAGEGPAGRLLLDPESMTVQAVGGGVSLDLGGIGKGFALDVMARVLRDWEIPRALLSAGGSSVLALDGPDAGTPWTIGLGEAASTHAVALENRAAGSSGRAVQGEHIIDPVTGEPAGGYFRTWAVAPTAAEADAFSTAWMILPLDAIADVCRRRPDVGAIVLPARSVPMVCLGSVSPPGSLLSPRSDSIVC